MTFDLHKLVRDVLASSTMTDPATLAKEVGKRIGRSEQAEALEQALPIVVRQMVSRSRGSHGGGAVRAGGGSARRATQSAAVAGIRQAWQGVLGDRLAVGPDPSDWKFLGDCTAEDLDYAAMIREDHAARNVARAAQFRRLSGLLVEHGVDTVGELPPDLLDAALGDAA